MSCTMGTCIDGYKPFWLPACFFVRINSLYECSRARLVLRWVTVRGYSILVFNQAI